MLEMRGWWRKEEWKDQQPNIRIQFFIHISGERKYKSIIYRPCLVFQPFNLILYLYLYIKPDDLVIKVHKPADLIRGEAWTQRAQKIQTFHIVHHQPQGTSQECQPSESTPHQRNDCFQNWNRVKKYKMCLNFIVLSSQAFHPQLYRPKRAKLLWELHHNGWQSWAQADIALRKGNEAWICSLVGASYPFQK